MPIRGTTRLLGILGNPLDHSWSPAMHNYAIEALGLDLVYVPFPSTEEQLPTLLKSLKAVNFLGVNVTMPYKQVVMPLLDELSVASRVIGAVNTITHQNGKLVGHTTDPAGFLGGFREAGHSFGGKSVVVLGNGGSARTIAYTLVALTTVEFRDSTPGRFVIAARNVFKSKTIADEINNSLDDLKKNNPALSSHPRVEVISLDQYPKHAEEFDVVVNTTPVGMATNPYDMPISADLIFRHQIIYDIISNPEETFMVQHARSIGAQALGGLGMLIHQGRASFHLWTGKHPDAELFKSGIRRQQAAMRAAAA